MGLLKNRINIHGERKIVIGAHQPNFLPYLGFFDKMNKSDIFVIRDEVLFVKRDFHNRNRIRINSHDNEGLPMSKWLKVPVNDVHDYIMHVPIKNDANQENLPWKQNILRNLKINYSHSPYFQDYYPEIEKIFIENNGKLIDLNMRLIEYLRDIFCIKTKIIYASELGLKERRYMKSDASKDLVSLCKELGGDVYMSGPGAKSYLNLNSFKKESIKVEFQKFEHPVYTQNYKGFIPNMAAIDALFCAGPNVNREHKLEAIKNVY